MKPGQLPKLLRVFGSKAMVRWLSIVLLGITLLSPLKARADALSAHAIVFVTMVPNPVDFGTLAATFGNHIPNPENAFRGGDLWIRYPDGSLKNLTLAAGYGTSGMQGLSAIAVRDPAVHWDGTKVIFSMLIGAPTQQYQVNTYYWQLYEMTGLGPAQTPVATKVSNQPTTFNNISPTYASDDTIIFVSDRPRDSTVLNTYPQRDEYESSPVNSGLWKLNPANGDLKLLDHAPSGDFNPIVDSFGRVIFTRWDHLQRDQQNVGGSFGAFNFASETSSNQLNSAAEVYPEPRASNDPDRISTVNLFTINQFFPWMMNQDGTDMETLNHIGRQEVGLYSERSFNNDPNVQEFYGQYTTGQNHNDFTIFLHIKEDPNVPGTYFGTSCQEFGTHSSGQIISINGAPGVNPDAMLVTYLTHPDTAGATDTPSGNHSGLYRDALPLSNGKILVSHTSQTRQDSNIGTSANPASRYAFRLKLITKPSAYYVPGDLLTSGITKSVSFWSPDQLVSYSGPLWEVMPVELKARTQPSAPAHIVPEIESAAIASLGIDLAELTSYLRSQNLALVVSRNLTTRDRNDRQQPTNLRVTGTSTQSLPHSGKIYDISRLEFFQGDLIRGYTNSSGNGRRVLAQRMHTVASGLNPQLDAAPSGSVQIAEDGSMAAFVPAGRALTWQMTDNEGSPVVRERYWVTFQPGEVRVCASCHGINTADHLGNGSPSNTPLALTRLLEHWRTGSPASPTPTPTSGATTHYSLRVKGLPSIRTSGQFYVTAAGKNTDLMRLRITVGGFICGRTGAFASAGTNRRLYGRFPDAEGMRIRFELLVSGSAKANTKVALPGTSHTRTNREKKVVCGTILSSLRTSN